MTAARQRRDGALAFIQREAAGGLLLVGAAIAALLVANSPLQGLYRGLLSASIGFSFSGIELEKPVLLWINDGLMVIFFFPCRPRDQARTHLVRALEPRQSRLAGPRRRGRHADAGAHLHCHQCG